MKRVRTDTEHIFHYVDLYCRKWWNRLDEQHLYDYEDLEQEAWLAVTRALNNATYYGIDNWSALVCLYIERALDSKMRQWQRSLRLGPSQFKDWEYTCNKQLGKKRSALHYFQDLTHKYSKKTPPGIRRTRVRREYLRRIFLATATRAWLRNQPVAYIANRKYRRRSRQAIFLRLDTVRDHIHM